MIQPGRPDRNPSWADDPVMMTTLELTVPLWQAQLRRYSFTGRRHRAQICAAAVAERGDILQYGVKEKTKNDTRVADVFNRLAEGLAALSFQPGGVTFCGHHWECDPGPDRTSSRDDIDRTHQVVDDAVDSVEKTRRISPAAIAEREAERAAKREVVTLPPDPQGRL